MNRWFLVLATFFGTIYVFLIPPFQAPDEDHHFFRTYHVAQGYLLGEKTDDQRFGGELPASLEEVSERFRYLRYEKEKRTSLESILQAGKIPLEKKATKFIDFPNVAYYATTAYLPQAVFLKMGSLLSFRPLLLLYATRLINLLFWLGVVYCAIHLMPFHQKTLAFLALLPASLVFHAGINADAVTNSLCLLWTAYLLHLAFTKTPLQYKHIWLLLIAFIITINKVVYAPIFLLAWLIPVQKFGHKRNYLLINGGLLLFHVALIFFWYKIAGDLFIPYDEYNPMYRDNQQLNEGVDPMQQLAFIFSEPLAFANIFWNSYTEIFPHTLIHYVGKFGWEGNYLPIWTLIVLLLSIVAIPFLEEKEAINLKLYHRFLFIGIGTIMLLAFSVVIYMQWNAPGDAQITALAGRYFIPIFPFFFFAMHNGRRFFNNATLKKLMIAIVIGANVVCMYSVWMRYYL